MTRSNAFIAVLAGAVLLPASSFGQPPPQPAPAPAPGGPSDTMVFIGNGAPIVPFGGRIDVVRNEGSVVGKVVKDKPYSADSVTESTQILADGNRITSRNEARFYRDSAGRTRSEQQLAAVGPWQTRGEPVALITLNDPVADVSYSLNTADQTAWRFRPFKFNAVGVNMQWQAGTAVTAPLPALPPGAATFALRGELNGRADGPPPETFEIPVPPPGEPAEGGVRVRTYGSTLAVGRFSGVDTSAATEDLGEQILEGVLARGTRHTETIAAGAIGNERPIEIVAEEWYSSDIEAVVLRRNVDPRFGETIYRLVNVSRSEQAPDLFAVPSGYTIQGEGAPGGRVGVAATEQRDAGGRVERRVFLVQPKEASPTK
ncbi:MAG TPA: hypothetical protein VE907_03850 [Gammaproteobacteria bacterium]|nr:hypothetical protein [Gammaproteobacteria bacterium]